jgi:hypothetical protein
VAGLYPYFQLARRVIVRPSDRLNPLRGFYGSDLKKFVTACVVKPRRGERKENDARDDKDTEFFDAAVSRCVLFVRCLLGLVSARHK